MSYRFRHSICNEVFEGWKLADTCKAIRRIGYDGIEISPFTLNEYPAGITPAQRAEYRSIIEGEGLHFVGLHWLMVSPKGLHVTTGDEQVRERSWKHIRDLIHLCADLAGDREDCGVMVFGSPKQRGTTGGMSREEATRRWKEGLEFVAPLAQERRVTILVEALPKDQCDIVNTLADASAMIREIGLPSIQTMFDTHNAADETDPHAAVVERHFDMIRHVHVNEMDGRHPGTGGYDFKPVLDALRRRDYRGWVSLEVFDFSAGAEKIAADSLRYLEGEIGKLGS